MSTSELTTLIPTGTWEIDPSHSSVNFSARHLMVSKVRGRFASFHGTITVPEDPQASSVNVVIDTTSIDTRDENRDAHLKSADFLDVEKNPTISFSSTRVSALDGSEFTLTGDLTIAGVTKPVELKAEFNGVPHDPWGGTRAGFEARTEFNRKDFGLGFNVALEGGGVLVGEKVTIELEVEAVLAAGEAK
jgi:polyisoprenoid-binding protein YceI